MPTFAASGVSVESQFYPEIRTWYDREAEGWYAQIMKGVGYEDEDESDDVA